MDTAVLITLVGTLLVSIVGNIAAWWQIAAQSKKDKRQADIDDKRVKIEESKAETEKEAGDRAALLAVIDSLKLELERLQKRGIELESTLIAKTTENGELKLAAIDKEAEFRTMKYNMESMQARLTAMSKKPLKGTLQKVGVGDNLLSFFPTDFSSDMLMEIEEDQKRKDMITESVNMEIEELRDNSIGNEIET